MYFNAFIEGYSNSYTSINYANTLINTDNEFIGFFIKFINLVCLEYKQMYKQYLNNQNNYKSKLNELNNKYNLFEYKLNILNSNDIFYFLESNFKSMLQQSFRIVCEVNILNREVFIILIYKIINFLNNAIGIHLNNTFQKIIDTNYYENSNYKIQNYYNSDIYNIKHCRLNELNISGIYFDIDIFKDNVIKILKYYKQYLFVDHCNIKVNNDNNIII